MKFTVDRLEMLNAVKKVTKALPKMSPLRELTAIKFDVNSDSGTVSVTCTDLNTKIQCRLSGVHIEETGSFLMDKIIVNILSLLSGDTVEFESSNISNNVVAIKSGNTLYELPVMDIKNYPVINIPFPEDFICIQNIGELVKNTAFAAENNGSDTRGKALQNIKLQFSPTGVTAQAMNANFGAFAKSDKGSDGSMSLIIHEKALGMLCGLLTSKDTLYVGVSGKIAVFMKEGLIFQTLLYNGDYSESVRLMERINPVYSASVDSAQLLNLADGITSIFASDDDKAINMCFTADKVVMQTITATGKSISSIEAKDVIVTPENGFYYQSKNLIDCIKHTSGEIKLAVDKNGFLMLSSGENRYFMAPRRATQIKVKKEEKKTKTVKNSVAKVKKAA